MANWTLYLRDFALEAVPVASAGWTNGTHCANGYDTMVSYVASSGTLDWTFTSVQNIRNVAIGNHAFASGTVQLYYYSGGWQAATGGAQAITAYTDKMFTWSSSNTSTQWRVTITATGKIGCVSMFTASTSHVLEYSVAGPVFPVDSPLNAGIATQETATGNLIEQRRGGAYRTFQIRIPNLRISSSGAEGLLDDTFLEEIIGGTVTGAQGWVGPFWMTDDNSKAYHVHVLRPIQFRWTGGAKTDGPFGEAILTLRTTPRLGLG